jgi:hypothetical protein
MESTSIRGHCISQTLEASYYSSLNFIFGGWKESNCRKADV